MNWLGALDERRRTWPWWGQLLFWMLVPFLGLAAVGAARPAGARRWWFGAAIVVLVVYIAAGLGNDDDPTTDLASTAGTPEATVAPVTTTTTVPEGVPLEGDDRTVERVVDGDTLVVDGGERVRLIGIDTPETKHPTKPVECFGVQASRQLEDLLPVGTLVRLVYDLERTDRYGRTLAYVYSLDDGKFVNARMLRDGYAQLLTVPPNVEHVDQFRALQAAARDADRGLWDACSTTTTAPPSPTTVAPSPTSPPVTTGSCHPSYDPCVPIASDVDCAGGSGNGPAYVDGPVTVTGYDEYGLDSDHDGIGCED